jgi:hypothetical protein
VAEVAEEAESLFEGKLFLAEVAVVKVLELCDSWAVLMKIPN